MDSGHQAKFLLVFLSMTLLTGLSMGASIGYNFGTIEYDKEEYVTINCYGSGCPYEETIDTRIKVEMCGGSTKVSHDSGTEYGFTLQFPEDGDWNDAGFNCDVGLNSFDVYDPEAFSSDPHLGSGTFRVSYSHGELSGGILAFTSEFNDLGTNQLHTWQIYNGGAFGGENGEIRIKEVDTITSNDKVWAEGLTGYVLSDSRTGDRFVDNLKDLSGLEFSSCGRGTTCWASELELGTSLEDHCGGNCPMGKLDSNEPAKFRLRGEIVVGKEFDPDNGFPEGIVEKSEKRFHLCDSSVDGIHDIEGRTVYSPRTDFDVNYLQCRNNQWIERPQCDPEEEWENGADGWGCYEKDPETIDVDFFNLEDVPYSDLTSEFLAGFRISSDELYDLESHYGNVKLQDVQAECWMGNNDNRPSSDSEKGKVSVSATSFRDSGSETTPSTFEEMYVLTQVPYRENVINSTYSCIWGYYGLYGPDNNQGLFQAVNDFTLKSRDSGKQSISYRELQQIYSSNSGSYNSGLTWEWDQDLGLIDSREHDTNELNPIEQEHPYCPGPPSGNDVIC
jgi:hypothetical protein